VNVWVCWSTFDSLTGHGKVWRRSIITSHNGPLTVFHFFFFPVRVCVRVVGKDD
jgi:hypothetical protein